MYKTFPIEWVLVISDITICLVNSGLYFHPPMTIITSKKIIILTKIPIGMWAELVEDLNQVFFCFATLASSLQIRITLQQHQHKQSALSFL